MRTLNVSLGQRSYSILIGPNLYSDPKLLGEQIWGNKVAIVTNETVAPLYLNALSQVIADTGVEVLSIILPDGEKFKNGETLNLIYDALMQKRCDRATTLIALGGGVIGDMCGFAAATYQRGVPFLQLPTTLLSQVDSSVGGKTGINHPLGKNMIGAFWQPKMVIADTDTLRTLPDRELSAGLAEVIKYGLIRDLALLELIESRMPALLQRDPDALTFAIERSCTNKADVVAGDEFETAEHGGRALLNLGHTFGHAIEAAAGYGNWLHGEAVAAGTVMAAKLSQRLGWLSDEDVARVTNLFSAARLPVKGLTMVPERYLELMAHDKKVRDGRLRLVLLKRIGEAITDDSASRADILEAIGGCCA